jgi:hypothetical protein
MQVGNGNRVASEAMNNIVEGIMICKYTLPRVHDSIRFNRGFDSNKIDESDRQPAKHDDRRISTSWGIAMNGRDDEENANDSIRFNGEIDSNESETIDFHSEKHDDSRISTSWGIAIERSDEF